MTDQAKTAHAIALVAGIAVAVGAFLPWYRVWFFTVNGTDGDGMFTLFLGGFAAVVAAATRPLGRDWTPGTMALVFVLAGAIGIYHIASADPDAVPQIGLWLTAGGALIGTAASIASWRLRPTADTATQIEATD